MRPVTVQEVVEVEQVREPGEEVTVYEVIEAPPVENGADQETTTDPPPLTPTTPVGVPGTDAGVTAADGSEPAPAPTAFEAVTVNVYDAPFVSPLTVQLVETVVQLRPPGDEITVYDVTAEPPLFAGADHETSTEESPNTPDTPVGAPGAVAGTTADDADEAEPAPAMFAARTANV